jgi:hypothetical protein
LKSLRLDGAGVQDSKQVRWLQELRMEEERLFISEFAGAAMDAILAGRPPTIEFGESLLSEEVRCALVQNGNRRKIPGT